MNATLHNSIIAMNYLFRILNLTCYIYGEGLLSLVFLHEKYYLPSVRFGGYVNLLREMPALNKLVQN